MSMRQHSRKDLNRNYKIGNAQQSTTTSICQYYKTIWPQTRQKLWLVNQQQTEKCEVKDPFQDKNHSKNNDLYKGYLHRKGTYECDGVKLVIS